MDSYACSIIMYVIGIWVVAGIYGERIVENGWSSEDVDVDLIGGLSVLLDTFIIACIPVVRFLYVAWLLVMATFTREAIESWFENLKNKF